jgi:hypothetical protein
VPQVREKCARLFAGRVPFASVFVRNFRFFNSFCSKRVKIWLFSVV